MSDVNCLCDSLDVCTTCYRPAEPAKCKHSHLNPALRNMTCCEHGVLWSSPIPCSKCPKPAEPTECLRGCSDKLGPRSDCPKHGWCRCRNAIAINSNHVCDAKPIAPSPEVIDAEHLRKSYDVVVEDLRAQLTVERTALQMARACLAGTEEELASANKRAEKSEQASQKEFEDKCYFGRQLVKMREECGALKLKLGHADKCLSAMADSRDAERKRADEAEATLKDLGPGPFVPQHQYDNVCKQREEAAKRAGEWRALQTDTLADLGALTQKFRLAEHGAAVLREALEKIAEPSGLEAAAAYRYKTDVAIAALSSDAGKQRSEDFAALKAEVTSLRLDWDALAETANELSVKPEGGAKP